MSRLCNKWLKILFVIVLVSFTSGHFAKSEESIEVWSYYDFPPFMTGDKQGLLFDLVDTLNDYADGEYLFTAKILPRKRLDKYIANGQQAVVPFVHWSYMKDKNKTKYLWSPVLMNDQNEFVSRASHPVIFDGKISSLYGLRFGAVLGHRYVELEESMATEKIIRVDTKSTRNALLMVLSDRLDFTSMSRPVLQYYLKEYDLKEEVYISKIPRVKYTRHFMVTKGLEQEFQFLNDFIDASIDLPEWQNILQSHGY